jgi:GH24 family phage-related lysozyme (muramidase)
MAVDLSGVRARQGKERRSTGSVPDAGAPTQKLRPTTVIAEKKASPGQAFVEGLLPGLGDALKSFATAAEGLDQIEQDKKLLAARMENSETLNKFRREVQTNKDAVLSAIKTGDYSGLSFDATKFIDRTVIRNNVHQMVGVAQAYEDMPALEETINQIDDPMVLSDAISKFVGLNTQGVQSDFYASAYGETLMAAGRKFAAKRTGQIAEAGKTATRETIRENLFNELLNPGNVWDADGMIAEADQTANMLIAGGYSPEEAALLAPEMVDKAIIANIGRRPDLFALVNAPDPTRGMSTIMERYPGQVRKAVDAHVGDERALMLSDGRRAIHELDRAVTVYGSSLQTMTLDQMFENLYNIRQTYGQTSPEYRRVEARLLAAETKHLKDVVDISMFTSGVMGPMTDKDYNAAADRAFLLMGQMSPDQQLNTMSILAEHGIEGPLRQRLQRMLNGTPEQAEEAGNFIMGLRDASQSGDYDDYLDTLPASKLKASEYLRESGLEAATVQRDVDDITDKMDPWTYFETSQLAVERDDRGVGVQQGQRGSHNLAMEVWDDYNDVLGSNDSADWGKLPLHVRGIAKDAVNLAAYHLRNSPHNEEHIKELAKKIMIGQLTFAHSVENGMVPQRRVGVFTPRAENPLHKEQLAQRQDLFKGDAEVFNEANEFLPTVDRTIKDEGYRLGRGELVVANHGSGVPLPARYAAGPQTARTMPTVTIPEALKDLMVSVDDSVEGVFHGYIRPGFDGETLEMGNGFNLVYNEANSSWEQRWVGSPQESTKVSIEDVVKNANPLSTTETVIHTTGAARNNLFTKRAERMLKQGIIDEETYNRMMEGVSGTAEEPGPPVSDEEFLRNMHDAITKAEQASFEKTSNKPGAMHDLINSAGEFITKGEGVRTVAYDDYTGKSIVPGRVVKGNPTVGHGFNLNRKDAKQKLEAMGYDYKAIREGRERISEADAIKLRNIVIQEEMNWLSGKLIRNGVDIMPLTNNQWAALLSMSYNGRSLITKDLIKAMKDQNWTAASQAIKEAKGGAWSRLPEGVRTGLKMRRRKEANLFLGLGA